MELVVQNREKFGKASKHLRKEGIVPAEFYSRGAPNAHLSVPLHEFQRVWRQAGENTIITLVVGDTRRPVLIHDIQKNPITGKVIHIDFYGVRMDEKLKVRIPIEYTGEAPVVKTQGGILNTMVSDIEVEVLPQDMPRSFVVDLGTLHEINQSIHVRDLRVHERVKVLLDSHVVLVTVGAPAQEVVETPIGVEDVKVETEEKKAEREASKTKENREE